MDIQEMIKLVEEEISEWQEAIVSYKNTAEEQTKDEGNPALETLADIKRAEGRIEALQTLISYASQVEELKKEKNTWKWIARFMELENLVVQIQDLKLDKQRLDWLDFHTSFVPDEIYRIKPYKVGELRQMADDGLKIDKDKGQSKLLQRSERLDENLSGY